MSRRAVFGSLIGILCLWGTAPAQGPYRPPAAQPSQTTPLPPAGAGAAAPSQPPYPTIQRRSAPEQQPQQQPGAPFVLTPQQQAELDRVLAAWEQQSVNVKTFDSKFIRWQYDEVFNKQTRDQGELRYASPDKGSFHVMGDQPERWICDGKAIFQYNFVKKELVEHRLPPELQGKGITNSPLPFLFGSTAEQLKDRYFLRVVTPPNVQGQMWLQALPRYRADAENFQCAEVILDAATMLPSAIQTHENNGKTRTVYQFENPRVNPPDPFRKLDPLGIFERDPFKPSLPRDWTKVIKDAPATQEAARPPAAPRR